MTIRSHPWLKLLAAIIAGIVAGILSDSWGWGAATFLIFMFIFIFVMPLFGGTIKGKVEVNKKLEELLETLRQIGMAKNELPFYARGWLNILGLYVQLRNAAGIAKLQAGAKYHSQIDAWWDVSDFDYLETGTVWKVEKYHSGDWEKLIEPTFAIANWLTTYGYFPKEHEKAFNIAIDAFKKEGHLVLPPEGKEPPLSRHSQVKRGTYISVLPSSVDMLREVGGEVYVVEDTKVIIDKVEHVLSAGMTYQQAFDFSSNGEWRNKIRMALGKKTGRIV